MGGCQSAQAVRERGVAFGQIGLVVYWRWSAGIADEEKSVLLTDIESVDYNFFERAHAQCIGGRWTEKFPEHVGESAASFVGSSVVRTEYSIAGRSTKAQKDDLSLLLALRDVILEFIVLGKTTCAGSIHLRSGDSCTAATEIDSGVATSPEKLRQEGKYDNVNAVLSTKLAQRNLGCPIGLAKIDGYIVRCCWVEA